MILAFVLNLKGSKEDRAFDVLNVAGYNIGCFTIPFAQSFLGSMGVITCSLFDVGNAIICLGGAFSVASMVKDGNGFSAKRIVKALSTSVPFVTYLIMVTLNLTHIPLPSPLLSCLQIIANANAFLAMFMLGVGFNLTGDFTQIGTIIRVLSLRYGLSALMAAAVFFLLPFDHEVRSTLVILLFSPISAIVPAFTGDLGEDVGLSSAINSMSIVCSIVIIVVLLSVLL
jgi:predicted permease